MKFLTHFKSIRLGDGLVFHVVRDLDLNRVLAGLKRIQRHLLLQRNLLRRILHLGDLLSLSQDGFPLFSDLVLDFRRGPMGLRIDRQVVNLHIDAQRLVAGEWPTDVGTDPGAPDDERTGTHLAGWEGLNLIRKDEGTMGELFFIEVGKSPPIVPSSLRIRLSPSHPAKWVPVRSSSGARGSVPTSVGHSPATRRWASICRFTTWRSIRRPIGPRRKSSTRSLKRGNPS